MQTSFQITPDPTKTPASAKAFLCAFILASAVPLAATAKKPQGTITDRAAFGNIRSYCVDMTDLPGWEALDVRNLIETETKPKRLLTKLPWTLKTDCAQSQPDAVVVVKFRRMNIITVQAGAQPDINDPERRIYDIKANLQVSDRDSSRLLYDVEAGPVNSASGRSTVPVQEPDTLLRRDAAYHAFWALIDDVRRH